MDRADRGRVVVHQARDPRLPGRRQAQLLVQLPAQRVVDDVVPVDRIDVAAHADRAQAEEAFFAALVGPAEQEDLAGPRNQGIRNDLLERGVLLDPRAVGKKAAAVDATEEVRDGAGKAKGSAVGEQIRAPDDVDLLRHGDLAT